MTKCDFCTKYHNGKCYWSSSMAASLDCEKAIERMIKVLQSIGEDKKRSIVKIDQVGKDMKCPYREFQECMVEQCPSCNYIEEKKEVI